MSVTAKDIAKHLKLSQPTVSRVLSGDPKHRVSPATRQLILEAAKRTGYQPNALARSLRRGHTNVIGFYSNHHYDARNDFQGTIVGSLQIACENRDFDLFLHSALHGRPAKEMAAKLRDGRIDGLILHTTGDDPLVQCLEGASLPIVVIADPLSGFPAVTCDDIGGMHLAIDYLCGRGYRRFAYLAPRRILNSVDRRCDAFEIELAQRGVPADARTVLRIDWENVDGVLEQLLASREQTAVCCWNDRTAYKLLAQCLSSGVKVPEQIAVMGFDGFVSDRIPARHLVTIRCPWEHVASTAFDLLIDMVNDKVAVPGHEVHDVCLPVTLVEGDTA